MPVIGPPISDATSNPPDSMAAEVENPRDSMAAEVEVGIWGIDQASRLETCEILAFAHADADQENLSFNGKSQLIYDTNLNINPRMVKTLRKFSSF